MRTRTLTSIAAAFALIGPIAAALAPPSPAAEDLVAVAALEAPELLLFEEIPTVVTASRMEQRITEAPASVTVITREQILASGAISIPDILRMAPGVDVMQDTGAFWDVSTRGFIHASANKILVLVDGRTVYHDLYAAVNWYALPVVVEDIERIEIIRGPMSSLWGANAYLGVINIITRSAQQAQGTVATTAWGSRGTLRASVVHAGEAANSRVRYKISAAREEVGQWAPSRPDARPGLFNDRKAGEVTKANAQLEWESSGGARWSLSASKSKGPVALVSPGEREERLWQETIGWVCLACERDGLGLRAYWNESRTAHTHAQLGTAVFYTDLYNVEALKSSTLGKHELVYGASYRQKQVGQGGVLWLDGPHHQRLWAMYAQDAYRASEKTRLVLAGRYDRHPLAGDRFSGKVTLMHSPTPDQTLRLSAATAFRGPSFLESYAYLPVAVVAPTPMGVFGDTDLDHEGVQSYDLEYRVQLSPRTSADVAVYYTKPEDLIYIELVEAPQPFIRYANLGSARARGTEVEVRHALSACVSTFVNYTYQYLDGDEEIERACPMLIHASPRHKANLGFTLLDPERGLRGSLLVSYRDKVVVEDDSAGPYVLVNGYVGKKVGGHAEYGISFFNLANDKHQQYTQGDYIGRRIMGSVRWEF